MSVVAVSQLPSPFSRSTYVHPALHVRLHARHVGATHVSKETAISICGTATGTARQLIFSPVAHSELNALVIAMQRLRFFPLRNISI